LHTPCVMYHGTVIEKTEIYDEGICRVEKPDF
jgi:hypothetical protein